MKTIRIIIIAVVLFAMLGMQEGTTIRIEKEFLVYTTSEAVEIVEKYLNKGWNRVWITDVLWYDEINAGYKYKVEVMKREYKN